MTTCYLTISLSPLSTPSWTMIDGKLFSFQYQIPQACTKESRIEVFHFFSGLSKPGPSTVTLPAQVEQKFAYESYSIKPLLSPENS